MPRTVDKRKTRKALRKLKLAAAAAGEDNIKLSAWEKDFVAGVSERLETYGSAFNDPSKGPLDEALSLRQSEVVRQLVRKSRPRRAAAGGSAPEAFADRGAPDAGTEPQPPAARPPMRRGAWRKRREDKRDARKDPAAVREACADGEGVED